MSNPKKCRPSQMSVRILLTLLQNPGKYNRTRLAEKVGISRYRINWYLDAFSSENITVDENQVNKTFTVLLEESHKALKNIMSMDEHDIKTIKDTLNNVKGDKAIYLNRKLDTLYDFQKLGLRSLRKPHLAKMDKLEQSIIKKKRVTLLNYRSNSNEIKNRYVECFLVQAKYGTIQVYDIERKDVRHFKLDRIDQVTIENETWEYEHLHHQKETDDFRIADDQQIHVHLTLSVKGYNLILDTYPQANDHILPNGNNTFDYAAKVNHNFLGIAPFILANTSEIVILEPTSLKEKIISMADTAKSNVRNSHINKFS